MSNEKHIYENAPLIEIIAEIHWGLRKLGTAPDTKIDPYYDLFRDDFLKYAAEDIGLSNVQELVPNVVPLELIPNQPTLRLRSQPDKWPLAQLGPGVLTGNMVPPYDGWAVFASFIEKLVDGLFRCYPIAQKTLFIEKLHLRYIDGFDKSFGLKQYSTFAHQMLGVAPPLSNHFIKANTKKGTEVLYILETHFSNTTPDGSSGKMKITPGKKDNIDALIMELHCDSIFQNKSATNQDSIKNWFDQAHQGLREQFDALTTPDLKILMQNKQEYL